MIFDKKDFILCKRGAYSQEGCEYAIKFFEKRNDKQVPGAMGGYGYHEIDHERKKCVEMYLKRDEYTFFEDVLQGCMREYREKYPYTKHMATYDIDPAIKMQRYYPGEGYFAEHCENCMAEDIRRIFAWMIYLNDVTDGGHTVFPHQNRKFQPKMGDVLIWPAYFTHTHYGMTSKTQTKYIATGWFSAIEDPIGSHFMQPQ